MTQLGTPAAPSLTSYEDAFAIKDMVERAFGSHVDAYKKCMSLRLETPGEIKTRDGLKRQLDLLRLESVPRYHALKRQLDPAGVLNPGVLGLGGMGLGDTG